MLNEEPNRAASADNLSFEHDPQRGRQPAKRRRGWLRFLYQFSLRSLLIVTTLVAVGCWWYLQPETRDEPLAGDEMKLRRQVRTVRVLDRQGQPLNSPRLEENYQTISDGSYRIVDLHDDLLVDGRMSANEEHGWWTVWHASGEKAVEGQMRKGTRVGVWKTWYADGKPASETTYVPITADTPQAEWRWVYPSTRSHRHGPARAWHASGTLKLEGEYVDDARSGRWTYYDEQGQIAEQGAYVNNRREGEWRIQGADGRLGMVVYVAGRTQEEHDELLATLSADLRSKRRVRQLNAARKLEELGPAGVPLLVRAFREGDEGLQLLALRSLVRLDAVSADLIPQVKPLADHADPGLALRAMLALVGHSQKERSTSPALVRRLLERAIQCPQLPLRRETLLRMCQFDEHRPEAFPLLIDALAESLSDPPDRLTGGTVVWGGNYDEWRVAALDVEAIAELDGDLTPLLADALASPQPEVRAVVMRVVERLVERGPPDREEPSYALHWTIPQELRPLVEQGMKDPSDLVSQQAEAIGIEQWWGGCFSGGFSAFGGFGGGGGAF